MTISKKVSEEPPSIAGEIAEEYLASSDIKEQCSGTGNIPSNIKLEGVVTSGKEARDVYVVQGLVNLGNTCFFNSICQNLLSLDQLRNHFLKEDGFGVSGPLASSLKTLFTETKPEAGLKSVIDPKAFFESFCSKVPQFKGYDQHDSHELLRCLLDSLSTEESALRKERGDSDNDQKSTLIDSVFRGETSSIVSCMECGHSSTVYEPFLDLSLHVPFKKTSPKKAQTVSRAKNAKLPPKRFFKNVSKVSNGRTNILHNTPASSGDQTVEDNTEKLIPDSEEVADGECEASSSFEPQNNDFVDFSSFFDEPEMDEGPVFGPPAKAEASGVGFMASSSESDPEEIDDSDSPVSVERCLTHFAKPEILSNDNAWHCENCSKNLKLQRLREKQKSEKDEYRSSNASKGVKEHERENGVLGETDLLAVIQDPRDTSAKDHNSNGKKPMRDHSANESDSKGAHDDDKDSEKLITVKRDATKRVLINKAPPVLTIHLKRFSQDLRGRLSKLNGHIAFKEVIDLQQYMDSRCNEEDPPVYRLAGLVEHSGTMRGGHYVAYVRGAPRAKETDTSSTVWYNVSDANVRQVSLEEVLHSEAYILFYERIVSQD